jgi:hypothetical protein
MSRIQHLIDIAKDKNFIPRYTETGVYNRIVTAIYVFTEEAEEICKRNRITVKVILSTNNGEPFLGVCPSGFVELGRTFYKHVTNDVFITVLSNIQKLVISGNTKRTGALVEKLKKSNESKGKIPKKMQKHSALKHTKYKR